MRRSDFSPDLIREARVLVIDDHEPNVRLLEAILRRGGLEHITGVTDPREALRLFAEMRPDLVLLDLHMPHIDGFAMLERFQALRDGDRYLPVLVLTADVEPAARQRALAIGAEDFVTKPFDAAEVVLRAQNLLETRFLYRELERRNIELAAEVAERSDEARDAVAARAAILASLNRLQPGATLEQTADAICAEFTRHGAFDSLSFLAFDADGSASVVASAGAAAGAAGVEPLDPEQAQDLARRAAGGPWSVTGDGRPETGSRPGMSQWFAPIQSDDEVLGLLRATGDPVAPGAQHERLDLLVEYAAIARALLVPALALRTHESAQRAGLQAVIRARAFAPVFQPIVDIRSGAAIGFEALTRFSDGVAPDARFSEADRIGLGLDLEEATLAAAIERSQALPAGSFLSLNVSPAFVVAGCLPAILARVERDVVLEITEHVPIADYESVRRPIAEMGPRVRLAIDDAGAGFASFRHILELRPDFVKLDRGLVHAIETDPSRQALVIGMRYFAETTACTLLAEGVETSAESDALRDLGVPFAQGYFFGRPQAAEEIGG